MLQYACYSILQKGNEDKMCQENDVARWLQNLQSLCQSGKVGEKDSNVAAVLETGPMTLLHPLADGTRVLCLEFQAGNS